MGMGVCIHTGWGGGLGFPLPHSKKSNLSSVFTNINRRMVLHQIFSWMIHRIFTSIDQNRDPCLKDFIMEITQFYSKARSLHTS